MAEEMIVVEMDKSQNDTAPLQAQTQPGIPARSPDSDAPSTSQLNLNHSIMTEDLYAGFHGHTIPSAPHTGVPSQGHRHGIELSAATKTNSRRAHSKASSNATVDQQIGGKAFEELKRSPLLDMRSRNLSQLAENEKMTDKDSEWEAEVAAAARRGELPSGLKPMLNINRADEAFIAALLEKIR